MPQAVEQTIRAQQLRIDELESELRELRRVRSSDSLSEQAAIVLESVSDGFFSLDGQFRFTYVNAAGERLLGRSRRDLIGRDLWVEYAPALNTLFESNYRKAMEERVVVEFEAEFTPWQRWFSVRAYPSWDGGIAVYFRDVTEQRAHAAERERLYAELSNTHALLDALFENAPVGMGFWDRQLRYQRVNKALADINGIPPEQHLGKTVQELLPEIEPAVMEAFRRVAEEGIALLEQPASGYTPAQPGRFRHWVVSYYPVRVGQEIVGVGAVCEEVTERRESELAARVAQAALRESEARFRILADTMPQLAWSTLPNGFHDYFNRQWYLYTGVKPGETDGEGWSHVLHPDDRERTAQVWQESLQTGKNYEIEYRFRRHDGEYRWFLARAQPIRNENGSIVRWFGTCTDIHDQRAANDALLRSNEDLQQFAYVASHDLQEPLRTIAGYTQLLARRYKDKLDDDANEYITYITEGTSRMRALIEGLLDFSRMENLEALPLKTIDSQEVLEKTLITLEAIVQESGATVEHGTLPKVLSDPGQLSQIFQNLISNAIKYRGQEAPRIEIKARREDRFWEFSVKDNGQGFDPIYAEQIFQVFQRLHGREVPGTGIGLALCRRIIERHGGRIWAESEEGKGSTFYFTVPAAD
jgi:PAS domain S-box-containing protein